MRSASASAASPHTSPESKFCSGCNSLNEASTMEPFKSRVREDEHGASMEVMFNGVWTSVPPPAAVKIREQVIEIGDMRKKMRKLLAAAKLGASALDTMMGDSDLEDDDSPEFKACQALNRAIDFAERIEPTSR